MKNIIDALNIKDISIDMMNIENKLIDNPFFIFDKEKKITLSRYNFELSKKSKSEDILSRLNKSVSKLNGNKGEHAEPLVWVKNNNRFYLDNPGQFFQALTGIDIHQSHYSLKTLHLFLQARLPKELIHVFGSLERLNKSDNTDYTSMMPIELCFYDTDIHVKTVVWANAQAWKNVLMSDVFLYEKEARCLADDFVIPSILNVGEITLSKKQWASLNEDDIVLIDKQNFDLQGVGELDHRGEIMQVSVHIKNTGSYLKVLKH